MHKGPRRFSKKKASKITMKHHANHKELEEEAMGKTPRAVPTYRSEDFIIRQK